MCGFFFFVLTNLQSLIDHFIKNVTEDKASEKIDTILSEKCPAAQRVKGSPSPHKVRKSRSSQHGLCECMCVFYRYVDIDI